MKVNKQKGVSLVELIVVMAILAILASVAIVGYTVFIKRAKQSKADQELVQVYNLIYMQADQNTIEIGTNSAGEVALFVTTSGNKIVLMFNDVPTKTEGDSWEYSNINHWQYEEYWNELIERLIDEVTGDIKMFSGRFELDPGEKTATEIIIDENNNYIDIKEDRNITYILENNEDLRSKKELIVTTVSDVDTITRFLNDLEDTRGKLVPEGRVNNEGEVEELTFEAWFVWTAAPGAVLSEELIGNLEIEPVITLIDRTTNKVLEDETNVINGSGDLLSRMFDCDIIYNQTITTNYPDVFTVTIKFNREPDNLLEYEWIQNNLVKIELIVKIRDIELKNRG